jgi:hypothetical protein
MEADRCVVLQRDRANRYAAGYTLTNLRPGPEVAQHTAKNAHLRDAPTGHLVHRGMRTWDGYGWSAAAVDGDTALRLDATATHPRSRRQLSTRVFCAVPALSRGRTADPEEEARIVGSINTSATREAFPIGEVDFARFDPGVCAVSVDHIVPQWTAGGESSRDIARSRAFRKAVRQYAKVPEVPGADDAASVNPSPPQPFREAQASAEPATALLEKNGSPEWHTLVKASGFTLVG